MKIESGQVRLFQVDPRTTPGYSSSYEQANTQATAKALETTDPALVCSRIEPADRAADGCGSRFGHPPAKALAGKKATGLMEASIHATVDQALWDLRAQRVGLPLHRLLGPTLRTAIKLYANINRGTRDRTPEGFAVRAKARSTTVSTQ